MRSEKYCFIFLLIFLCLGASLYAANPPKVQNFINHKDWSFVENKGQLADEKGNLLTDVKYYSHDGGAHLYCRPGMISFVFIQVENDDNPIAQGSKAPDESNGFPLGKGAEGFDPKLLKSTKITTCRADLILVGANPNTEVSASEQQAYYENYYLAHTGENGVTSVHTYKTITYKNIYPNIDMVLNPVASGVEYSFLVHPGGDVQSIKLHWNGMNSAEMMADGGIRYTTPLASVVESVPKCFAGGDKVQSSFLKNTDSYGFKIGSYDKNKTLLIDPQFLWGTYFGDTSHEFAEGIVADGTGNVFATGVLSNSVGLASTGAYQTSYSGGAFDAFLMKFSNSGSLAWATYYGGAGNDFGNSICADASGYVYISGSTDSKTGMATTGAFKTSLPGDTDAFVAKFNGAGTMQWATYFGGNYEERGNAITVDNSGNIILAGATRSHKGLATSGAYETKYIGDYEVFLAKFSNAGKLAWATYFSYEDLAEAVCTDGLGNIYVSGETYNSGGLATKGAFQKYFGGRTDAFLAKFNNSGHLTWSTYYGGAGDDIGYGVVSDKSGNVFITGWTESNDSIASIGAYQSSIPSSGYLCAFLTGFDSTGYRKWGTYYGGGNEYATGICMDSSGYLNITGSTFVNKNIATKGAYQVSNGGLDDAFLARFSPGGKLFWATFYGGKDDETSRGIAADKSGNVFITGGTNSNNNIATSGTFHTAYSGNGDVFVAKFHFNSIYHDDAGINAILSPLGSHCSDTFPVKVSLKNYGTSNLTSVSIGYSVNGKIQSNYNWTGKIKPDSTKVFNLGTFNFPPGKNLIKAWASKPNGYLDSLPENDTTIIFDSIVSPISDYTAAVGKCGHVTFKAKQSALSLTPIYTYEWSGNGAAGYGAMNIKSDSGAFQYTRGGKYYYNLKLKGANGCYSVFKDTVVIPSFVYVSLPKDTAICDNASPIKITATYGSGNKPYSFSWDNSSTTGSTLLSSITSDTVFVVHVKDGNGCTNYDSMKVHILTSPVPNSGGAKIICSNSTISIGTASTSGHTYSWTSNPVGFTSTISNPTINPTVSTVYYLTETNSKTGCSAIDSAQISVNPLPNATTGGNQGVCLGIGKSIGGPAVSGNTYSWTSKPSGFTSAASNPIVSPTLATTYYLIETITATGCTKTDSAKITVNPLPNASRGTDQIICQGTGQSIGGPAVSGNTYSWKSKPSGFTSSVSNPTVSPNLSTTYYLTETITATGCKKTDSVKITINPLPSATAGVNTRICQGATLSIGGPAATGNTYSWTSKPSGFTSSSSNPTVSPSATTTYYLTETITVTGCNKTDSIKMTVNPIPTAVFGYTNVCPGDSSSFTDKSTLANTYSWSFGDSKTSSLANPKHLYTSNGSFNVGLKVTTTSGCTDSTSQKIVISPCVWPGDANNDRTVDMTDLLNIGIAYGTKSHPRPSASLTWSGQPTTDWDSTFSGGINYKHADCNGDSVVDYTDTLAISANYGLSHTKSTPLNQGSPSDPYFTIQYAKDTFYAGDTLKALIMLGNSANPVKSLYGLKFSINANPLLFEADKTVLKLNTSFMGDPKTEIMGMKVNNMASGQIDIGLSRITHINANGSGNIAMLSIPIKTTLPGEYNKTELAISNNLQITYNQKRVPLYFTNDSVLIKQDKTGISKEKDAKLTNLTIYPNPFQSNTTIQYNLLKSSQIKIALFDITGKQVGEVINQNQIPGQYQTEINADTYHLNPGIYLLKFMMDGEVVNRELIKF